MIHLVLKVPGSLAFGRFGVAAACAAVRKLVESGHSGAAAIFAGVIGPVAVRPSSWSSWGSWFLFLGLLLFGFFGVVALGGSGSAVSCGLFLFVLFWLGSGGLGFGSASRRFRPGRAAGWVQGFLPDVGFPCTRWTVGTSLTSHA